MAKPIFIVMIPESDGGDAPFIQLDMMRKNTPQLFEEYHVLVISSNVDKLEVSILSDSAPVSAHLSHDKLLLSIERANKFTGRNYGNSAPTPQT